MCVHSSNDYIPLILVGYHCLSAVNIRLGSHDFRYLCVPKRKEASWHYAEETLVQPALAGAPYLHHLQIGIYAPFGTIIVALITINNSLVELKF